MNTKYIIQSNFEESLVSFSVCVYIICGVFDYGHVRIITFLVKYAYIGRYGL